MHARIATAVVVAAFASLAAGCGGGGQSAAETVSASVERTQEVESFHFTLDVQNVPRTSSGVQLTGAEGDVLVPDRAAADVTGNFSGIPISTQIVAIGDDVWLKNPLTGDWQTVDVTTTPVALLSPSKGVLAVMNGIADPNDEGTEEVDGVVLREISGTVSAEDVAPLVAVEGSDREVPVTLWIGDDDRLLRRVEVSGPVADGEPDDALRVVELSRFDEPVSIEAPETGG